MVSRLNFCDDTQYVSFQREFMLQLITILLILQPQRITIDAIVDHVLVNDLQGKPNG